MYSDVGFSSNLFEAFRLAVDNRLFLASEQRGHFAKVISILKVLEFESRELLRCFCFGFRKTTDFSEQLRWYSSWKNHSAQGGCLGIQFSPIFFQALFLHLIK